MKKGVQIFSVQGKTAMVTGATGYLGSAMANILAESGAHVLINSRSRERCDALVRSLIDKGYSAESAVFDVTDQRETGHFFSRYQDQPLHILINNAYAGTGGAIKFSKADDYICSYDVTMTGAHNMLIAALPSMRKAVQQGGDASVINMASMYALVSPDQRIYDLSSGVNPPFYGAAKAALLQWTRYAACEFGAEGIRVNSISPGPFPSNAVQDSSPDLIIKLAYKVPMGRIGHSDEIKGPTLFLASAASSFVNGTNLIVDGGWTSW